MTAGNGGQSASVNTSMDATGMDARIIDPSGAAALRAVTAKFRTPTLTASVAQLVSGFAPLIALYTAQYVAVAYGAPWWGLLALSVPTAAFIVRIFIFQHDCGHGSFFRSSRANHWTGLVCSVITMTPFESWRRQHAGHHLHWNDLDNRNSGTDIYSTCLTVQEFGALPARRQLFYRFIWHPAVSLVLLPPLVFLVLYRFPFDMPRTWRRERRSVFSTNVALALMFGVLIGLFGWRTVALVHLPTTTIAAIIGVWMFSLQHRFDGAQWQRGKTWTAHSASLAGSSHLKLPRILQWFTGNIGFHHIHHLDPRVPNYRLEACHHSNAAFASVPTVTLLQGMTAMRYCLWDEEHQRLVRMPKLSARFACA